jgi:hypothetical protein
MSLHVSEPIHWGDVLRNAGPPRFPGDPREQGRQFHHWLRAAFSRYEGLGFERSLTWRSEDGGWRYGRCDCFDGLFVYEFKTVSDLPENRRESDVEQLQGYLKGVGVDHGVLVYVRRGSIEVRQFTVEL